MLKKAGKYREPLSVQQLLDCVKLTDTDGCNGGTPMDGLDWLQNNAAATAAEYPYTGVVGTCVESRGSVRSAGWEEIVKPCLSGACSAQYKEEGQLLKRLNELKVPLIAYVDAKSWQNYVSADARTRTAAALALTHADWALCTVLTRIFFFSVPFSFFLSFFFLSFQGGGIFPADRCSSSNEAGNHVVEITGSNAGGRADGQPAARAASQLDAASPADTPAHPIVFLHVLFFSLSGAGDEKGNAYWMVRNSWDKDWGERGYIRLPMGGETTAQGQA